MSNEPSDNEISTADTQELQDSVESLEERIDTVHKTRWVFFRGVVSGLGGAVGATIVFTAIIAALSTVLYQLGWFPEFNDFITQFTARGSE